MEVHLITSFIPSGAYEDILNILGQWKIMDMKSLMKMTNYDVKYDTLLYRVRKLENNGLIKSTTDGSNFKYVYLSDKGLKYTPFSASAEISPGNLNHDLITGNVLRTLIDSEYFFDGMMYHQLEQDKVFPDAAVLFSKFDKTFRIGVEVELTQKTADRVIRKYNSYSKDSIFDYSLFITNKRPLYKTYCRLLTGMSKDVQGSNILLFDPTLSAYKFRPAQAECLYLGERVKYDEIFGE